MSDPNKQAQDIIREARALARRCEELQKEVELLADAERIRTGQRDFAEKQLMEAKQRLDTLSTGNLDGTVMQFNGWLELALTRIKELELAGAPEIRWLRRAEAAERKLANQVSAEEELAGTKVLCNKLQKENENLRATLNAAESTIKRWREGNPLASCDSCDGPTHLVTVGTKCEKCGERFISYEDALELEAVNKSLNPVYSQDPIVRADASGRKFADEVKTRIATAHEIAWGTVQSKLPDFKTALDQANRQKLADEFATGKLQLQLQLRGGCGMHSGWRSDCDQCAEIPDDRPQGLPRLMADSYVGLKTHAEEGVLKAVSAYVDEWQKHSFDGERLCDLKDELVAAELYKRGDK